MGGWVEWLRIIGVGGHVRVFTYKAMKQTLVLHKFKIVKVTGSFDPEPYLFSKYLWHLVERIMLLRPSFSPKPIFVIQKGDKQ